MSVPIAECRRGINFLIGVRELLATAHYARPTDHLLQANAIDHELFDQLIRR